MNMKVQTLLLFIAFAMTVSTAPGYYLTVPLGQYNITLNMDEKDVSVLPQPTQSGLDTITRSAKLQGEEASDWGMIYIYEHQSAQSLFLEESLRQLLKVYCTFPDTDQGIVAGMGGFVGTGTARIDHGFGKQECYAGMAALPGGGAIREIAIFGHFTNQTFNEQLVRDAKVEFTAKKITL